MRIIGAFLLGILALAAEDVITLSSGGTISGAITAETDAVVVIRTKNGPMEFRRERIRSIARDIPPPAPLRTPEQEAAKAEELAALRRARVDKERVQEAERRLREQEARIAENEGIQARARTRIEAARTALERTTADLARVAERLGEARKERRAKTAERDMLIVESNAAQALIAQFPPRRTVATATGSSVEGGPPVELELRATDLKTRIQAAERALTELDAALADLGRQAKAYEAVVPAWEKELAAAQGDLAQGRAVAAAASQARDAAAQAVQAALAERAVREALEQAARAEAAQRASAGATRAFGVPAAVLTALQDPAFTCSAPEARSLWASCLAMAARCQGVDAVPAPMATAMFGADGAVPDQADALLALVNGVPARRIVGQRVEVRMRPAGRLEDLAAAPATAAWVPLIALLSAGDGEPRHPVLVTGGTIDARSEPPTIGDIAVRDPLPGAAAARSMPYARLRERIEAVLAVAVLAVPDDAQDRAAGSPVTR